MTTIAIWQVDAFAARPFEGNPAAVCVIESAEVAERLDDATRQAVAEEMNLSETAFVEPVDPGAGRWALRWFTPKAEVELCGHATLASAWVLWTTGRAAAGSRLTFQTRYRGELSCEQGGNGRIAMRLPREEAVEATVPHGLIPSLGLDVEPVAISRGTYDWLVELPDAGAVRRAAPDFAQLGRIKARGAIVTARDGGEYDFVSRCFFPSVRIHEDPVTGSAHCLLGTYWASRLGKRVMRAYQASSRGGRLEVRVEDEAVVLLGPAVTVMSGELRL